MISLTRLNGKRFVVNTDLIRFVEATPDTMITLTTGDRIMVQEEVDKVVERAIEYQRQVRAFPT